MRSPCFGSSGAGRRLYPSSLIRLANDIPCSPSRAATVSSVAFTPSCGVTAAQAVKYSYAAVSARDTAFSRPRYDGLSDMSALRLGATPAVWQRRWACALRHAIVGPMPAGLDRCRARNEDDEKVATLAVPSAP